MSNKIRLIRTSYHVKNMKCAVGDSAHALLQSPLLFLDVAFREPTAKKFVFETKRSVSTMYAYG